MNLAYKGTANNISSALCVTAACRSLEVSNKFPHD